MVGRVQGQILGISTSDNLAPWSQVTFIINTADQPQVGVAVLSPSLLSGMAVGSNITLYLAWGSDVTAIEGAVSVVSVDSPV